jgi:hypothetical protein
MTMPPTDPRAHKAPERMLLVAVAVAVAVMVLLFMAFFGGITTELFG